MIILQISSQNPLNIIDFFITIYNTGYSLCCPSCWCLNLSATTQLFSHRKHFTLPWAFSAYSGANHSAPLTEMRHAVSVLWSNSSWTTVELRTRAHTHTQAQLRHNSRLERVVWQELTGDQLHENFLDIRFGNLNAERVRSTSTSQLGSDKLNGTTKNRGHLNRSSCAHDSV